MANPIATENALTGSSGWIVTKNQLTQIQAYTDNVTYNPGDTVTIYVSTQVAGTSYSVSVYRLGWYSGTGGRLMTTISGLSGQAQGYWNGSTLVVTGNAGALTATTGIYDCNWMASTTWTIPVGATTGIYLIQYTDANGYQTCNSFVVKGNSSADYLMVRPTLTDVAYNSWGGKSLYTNVTVDVQVSLNRPYVSNSGSGYLLGYDLPLIRWMERQGYNLSYCSNLDLHITASLPLTHGAMIFFPHDEYWTKEMRDSVEAAIAAGIGVAFTGANCAYWQCRLSSANASSSNPVANRTVTCYKVQTKSANLALDPYYGVDNTRVTSLWRDAILNRPENRMIGIMWSSDFNSYTENVAWSVDPAATSPYLAGTGLVPGSSYGTDVCGYEWDKVFTGGPNNLQIIGTTAVTSDVTSLPDTSNTTTYIASGGALVFASGSICWTWGLDSARFNGTTGGIVTTGTTIPGMQALMSNIMAALIRPKNQTGFNSFSCHR